MVGLAARLHQFAPRHHAQHGDVHHDIERGDDDDRQNERARNVAARIFDLAAKEADVVVAPVIVGRHQHRRAHAEKKLVRQPKCTGREVESARRVEVRDARHNHPADRQHHADPQQLGQPSDDGNPAIEQDHDEQAGSHGDERRRSHQDARFERPQQRQREMKAMRSDYLGQTWPQIAGVVSQSDAARGDGQRRAERELPHEQKRQQPPQRFRTVDFLQILIGAAGIGHGRAQFGPHQPIAEREDGAGRSIPASPADRRQR